MVRPLHEMTGGRSSDSHNLQCYCSIYIINNIHVYHLIYEDNTILLASTQSASTLQSLILLCEGMPNSVIFYCVKVCQTM